MRSVPAIAFEYRPSRWVAAALSGIALLAIVALCASGLVLWIRCVGSIAAVVYAAWNLRRLLRPKFDHATWHAAGHWRLRGAGIDQTAELVGARALGALLVLVFRVGPRQRTALALLPDNCSADTRRRLRVRLARMATAAA